MPMGNRAIQVDGMNVVMLQSEVAMCILTFLDSGGRLTPRKADYLRERLKSFSKIFDKFTPEGKTHFQKLCTISEMVLKSC